MKLNEHGRSLIDFLKYDDEYILETKKDAEEAIRTYVKIRLNGNQYAALLSFVMSEGIATFKKSKLLKLVNANDIRAAEQFDRYIYSIDEYDNRIVDPFLAEHREYEKAVFLMPEIVATRRRG